jgi:PPOX class probable F420-dependent enzyme
MNDSSIKKIPADDRRANYRASEIDVDRAELARHLAGRHQWVLATTRRDGRPQMSLVTGGMIADGRLAISTYPERVKAKNVRRNSAVSVAVMGEQFNDAWIQIDGDGEVIDLPDADDAFVEYYRSISGEHPDWDEYRQAMADQGKCMIVITPTRWSPLSKGGFPPSLFDD